MDHIDKTVNFSRKRITSSSRAAVGLKMIKVVIRQKQQTKTFL